MGASGVQIPMVNTAEQARDLVRRVRYPGVGGRGSAFSTRAAGYGAFGGPNHTRRSNEGIALIAMIETPEAVENATDIASVEGIDAVFVGPNDLSHAMGHGNDWACDAVQKQMEKAIRAVAAAGKCAGTLALTPEDAKKVAGWGANYLVSVTTSIMTQAFQTGGGCGPQRGREDRVLSLRRRRADHQFQRRIVVRLKRRMPEPERAAGRVVQQLAAGRDAAHFVGLPPA